jgi:heterodisulfide reductase subunit A2
VVAHLGDSTFFHSGIAPLVNAVYNNTRTVMIVLDNLTTAMTGMQPSPAASSNNRKGSQIRPENMARAAGIKYVRVVDPQDLARCIRTVKRAIKFEGPSFIVFRRPCTTLEQREMRARGEKVVPYHVDTSNCVANSPPFCTAACPLHIDVRGYVGLVGERKYDEALNLILQKLPFPGIMGRICTHPCESRCKRNEVDESIAIAALKRSAADCGTLSDADLIVTRERTEKVAVVGGGPAGLMAAYDLRKAGYQVTIWEALPSLGGVLFSGIPEYRLPRKVTQNEIERILRMGIQVKLNTQVGRDIKLSELKEKYSAVFIAAGAHKGRGLGIPNSDAEGVVEGIEFLKEVNLGRKIDTRNKVTIVGGGNVAVDCARTCLRLGFKEVKIVYRRSGEEMPAIPQEVKEAVNEGVRFTFLATPTRVLTSGNKVSGVECVRMRLGKPDATGRKRPIPVKGSEFIIETDLIITAVGEKADLDFINGNNMPLAVNNDFLAADPVTLATNIAGVFAGGDVVSGPATVIEALAAGRKAAISIERYLQGQPLDINREGEGTQASPLVVNTDKAVRQKRLEMPGLPAASRNNMLEVELGFSRDESQNEALRCLSCGCQICIKSLGCPAMLIENGEVTIDSSQCPGCGTCAQVCPKEAIVQDQPAVK